MRSTLCTLSVFLALVALLVGLCVVEVPVPFAGGTPMPLAWWLLLASSSFAAVAITAWYLWAAASAICGWLRKGRA